MPERFDVIVIGCGVAGLSASLEAAQNRAQVCVLDLGSEKNSNSFYAQGGIAAAMGKKDSWKKHYNDTINAGVGLCNERIVEMATKMAPKAIQALIDEGLEFDGGEKPDLGLEGGHSEHRALHINGDETGRGITEFLKKRCREEGVNFFENSLVHKIILAQKRFAGVQINAKSQTEPFFAKSLVIAGGGYAAAFEKTTNPKTTLGASIGVAASAGCSLRGMEFVQFHPTTLEAGIGGNYLVTESVRGEGGIIVNAKGKAIVDPLFTRDKVSRAIYSEISSGGKAFLDAREFKTGFFKERFPTVHKELAAKRINPETDLIPIETAAHYTIGGIAANEEAKTNLAGIFACGEASNLGLHGANRLACNSLLEGLVFGKIAGKNAAKQKKATKTPKDTQKYVEKNGSETRVVFDALKKVMWRCAGVVRNEAGLKDGLAGILHMEKRIEQTRENENVLARNALIVARHTFEAALARKKSVGTHYREN
ncbi:MAG: FAD-dependent oxidoreductase [archaeon]|nr:FAD-dependent oxidoreductase [archaeon]